MVEDGLTLRAMAVELEVSVTTVRRRLRRAGLETYRAATRRTNAAARADGLETTEGRCRVHGHTAFTLDSRGTYRCLRCRSAAVAARRRRVKEMLVGEAGGRCVACGYDRCLRALSFHHVDPATKSFNVGYRGHTRSLARARAEAAKCVLLCANCHMEVEAGVLEVA
jgi:hypothetical protein